MNYGPIQTLSDPKIEKQLRALLTDQGLVPIDVRVVLCSQDTVVRVTPPNSAWMFIEGISSNMVSGQVTMSAELQNQRVLADIDVGAFNLGHLVPMPLGCFSQSLPLEVLSHVIDDLEHTPVLSFTLWCRAEPVSWGTVDAKASVSIATQRNPPTPALIKALRLLKVNAIEVEDRELLALLDQCAPLL